MKKEKGKVTKVNKMSLKQLLNTKKCAEGVPYHGNKGKFLTAKAAQTGSKYYAHIRAEYNKRTGKAVKR